MHHLALPVPTTLSVLHGCMLYKASTATASIANTLVPAATKPMLPVVTATCVHNHTDQSYRIKVIHVHYIQHAHSFPPCAAGRHTARFLMYYLTLAPLLMWSGSGWLTVPLSGLVAFLLLSTENIGAQIEEPFTVLPLMAICK